MTDGAFFILLSEYKFVFRRKLIDLENTWWSMGGVFRLQAWWLRGPNLKSAAAERGSIELFHQNGREAFSLFSLRLTLN